MHSGSVQESRRLFLGIPTLTRSIRSQVQGARALKNEAHDACAAVMKGEGQRSRWGLSECVKETVSEGTQ